MKRAAELTVFAGIAALIHAALFAAAPRSGAQSSGAGGNALVSVQAADATMAEMVEAWQRPPQAMPQLQPDLTRPPAVPAAPAVPQFELAQAPRAAAQIALARPAPAQTVEVDTAPPPPPEDKPEAAAKPEPQPRPKPKRAPEPQQARQAAETSASRAGQRATGSGGGAQAGQAGGSAAATAQAGQRARLQAVWRARIERRKRYPSGASGSGVAVVRITVSRSGQLLNSRIAKSSGSAVFDQAALQAVTRAGKFPSAPKKLSLSQLTFNLPMSFSR